MARNSYPDWVLKYKEKGTELRFINGKYYLYKVHCERINSKNKKITDKYLGRITENGLMPPKEKFNLVSSFEYGFSFFMYKYSYNILEGLYKIDKRVAEKIFIISLFEVIYNLPFNEYLFKSSYLSILFNKIDFNKKITDNMKFNIDRSKKMITDYILKSFTSDSFYELKNILSTLHIIKIDDKYILPEASNIILNIYNKYNIKMEIYNEGK